MLVLSTRSGARKRWGGTACRARPLKSHLGRVVGLECQTAEHVFPSTEEQNAHLQSLLTQASGSPKLQLCSSEMALWSLPASDGQGGSGEPGVP